MHATGDDFSITCVYYYTIILRYHTILLYYYTLHAPGDDFSRKYDYTILLYYYTTILCMRLATAASRTKAQPKRDEAWPRSLEAVKTATPTGASRPLMLRLAV